MSSYDSSFTPDYASATGILQHLTTEELKQLVDNDEKLHNMIKDLQQVKNIEAEREILIASNKSLSEFNLSQKPKLEDVCQELEHLYIMASEIKEELLEKKSKLEQLKSQTTLDTVLALLQTATAEAEDDAEICIEKFLNGETPIATFLEEYLEKRKLGHLRRAKSEKMAVLLQQQNNQPLQQVNGITSQPSPPPRANRQKPPAPVPPASQDVAPKSTSIAPSRPAPKPPVFPSYFPAGSQPVNNVFPTQQSNSSSYQPNHYIPQPPPFPQSGHNQFMPVLPPKPQQTQYNNFMPVPPQLPQTSAPQSVRYMQPYR